MAEKIDFIDVKKGDFGKRMELRKKSSKFNRLLSRFVVVKIFLSSSLSVILLLSQSALFADEKQETSPPFSAFEERGLFDDLELIEKIDEKIDQRLPVTYNYTMMGGYFNMPSARMAKSGTAALGGAYVPPYDIYGINFQMFDRLELGANYRVFKGITEGNFGHEGFGDDAERVGNIKLGILTREDGFSGLPFISIGAEDFLGTRRFHSEYVVVTKEWIDHDVEATLGWGRGRIKGFFGGIAWTPFRQTPLSFLKNLTLMAEYDAINYKKHAHEHGKGRSVKTRINAGLSYVGWDALQISVSSLRGKKIAASASLRYPLGSTKGFFPKIDDPLAYRSPVDTEPLGLIRPPHDFAQQLAYSFSEQGLDLYTLYLTYGREGQKELWLKVINNRYRDERVVRDRLQRLLAALIPSDVASVLVVVEADGLPCQAYHFRTQDLLSYHVGAIGPFELETVAPMIDAPKPPGDYDSTLLFQRRKKVWTFTVRPRLLTFFGSTKGKFKYNLGVLASPEGYLFDEIYYKLQASYSIKSSMSDFGDMDRLNPSQLLNVRSDTIRYFQTNSISMEQAYVQRGWNLGKGWFYRLATGYFEPAYGGVATEFLYYPVRSSWAIGVEGATVWKRRYRGVQFTRKVRKFDGRVPHYVHFTGVQYFLDIYYEYKPLDLDFKVSIGQFLAKDKGARFEVERTFASGLKVGLWYTITNGHDHVNGHVYHDKGFAFYLPFDMFLKSSSLNYIGYAMSAWLRDVGASAFTGKRLYTTLYDSRYQY